MNYTMRINTKRIYGVIIALVPVLSVYATFVDGIYLQELFLIIFTALAIIYRKSYDYYGVFLPVIFLAAAIIFSCFLNVICGYGETVDVFVRSARMLFYIVCITFTSKRLLDFHTAISATVYIGIFAVAFLIFQTIVYKATGVYIKGVGNILPLAYRQDFDYQYYFSRMFRPSSIFMEPSGMSQYILVPLSYELLDKSNIERKRIVISVLLSIGILMTTSLWGVVILALIWGVWVIKVADIKRYFLILVVLIPLVLYFVINSSVFSSTMSRINMSGFDSIYNSQSFSGRFLGYDALDGMNTFEKLFGLGFGNLGVRKNIGTGNAVLYYLLGIGYVGTIMFYGFCLFVMKRINTVWQKTIFFAMLILSFGAGIINTTAIVYYYVLAAYTMNLQAVEGE